METGNFIHVLITVIGIIGAAAVALVCDMLKTNNERLREANLELQIRREEEQRRADQALDHIKRIAPLAGERALPGPARTLAAGESAPQVALAEAPGAAGQAGATMPEARVLAREFLATLAGGEDRERRRSGEPSAPGAPPPAARSSEPAEPARAPRKNWELLLKGAAHRTTIDVTPIASGRQRGELIPFESLHAGHPEPEKLRLRAGFHGISELSQLLESKEPLHGLVVSIALNGGSAAEGVNGIPWGAVREAAAEWVRGMLAPGEFGCRSAIDQFLIVIAAPPHASQDRLTEITAKLWDYQLRDDVSSNAILSWGSYEAGGEALPDAIRAAVQRMEENRRSRVSGASGRRRAI